MRKGDKVFYTAAVLPLVIEARVRTVHRDQTVTVEAMFALNNDGTHKPGCLGYKYRIPTTSVRSQPQESTDVKSQS